MSKSNKAKLISDATGSEDRLTEGPELDYSRNATDNAVTEYGLPKAIRANPLGCGCDVAYLAGVGAVVDGQIEADYQCDSGWHNHVLFQVKDLKVVREIAVDKFGNLSGDKGYKFQGLEEY